MAWNLKTNGSINKSRRKLEDTLRQMTMETQHSKSMRFNKSCSKSSLYQHKLSSENKNKNKKTSNKLPNSSAKKKLEKRKTKPK